MPGKMLDWGKLNANTRKYKRSNTDKCFKTIMADAAFWRAWKDDPHAMKEAGYRPIKTASGWEVRIETPEGH